MRRYTADKELRLGLQSAVREWADSDLLTPDQAAELGADLTTSLRTTGIVLRLVLGLFTAFAVAAAVALVLVLLEIHDAWPVGGLATAFGLLCFAIAEVLVADYRLYRHGVEEALVVMAVALCGVGAGFLCDPPVFGSQAQLVALIVSGLVSLAAYARFGFRYAAVGSLGFAASIPFVIDGLDATGARLAAALVCAAAFGVATAMRRSASAEVIREDADVLAAAAVAGGYLALNVHAGAVAFDLRDDVEPWFRWGTYVLTWIMPLCGVWWGVRERNRTLIDVAIAAGLVTLMTNKSYLGWPRQTWDPMLFGAFVAGAALAVRRWLSSGPGGERYGLTAAPIGPSDREVLELASMAPALRTPLPSFPASPPASSPPPPDDFGGGSFGGGGAGGRF